MVEPRLAVGACGSLIFVSGADRPASAAEFWKDDFPELC
jgi:hypothetical protein